MNIYQKSINVLRGLTLESIANAGSGHTGVCSGAAAVLFTLFKDHMVFNPNNPSFENRDRFVLSAGHAAPLYYSLLHLFGFDVSLSDLKNLRKFKSKTPGHPEVGVTPGVDASTGPLGQGIANAVGLAIAAKYQGKKFNTINMELFTNKTYCFVGDGCLMEGVGQEAISLAGTLGLDNLIMLYDKNAITIDGELEVANTENVAKKFNAMNWHVINVSDGNDYRKITTAITKAKKVKGKPTVVIFNTKIGYGTLLENTSAIHGKPLSKEELKAFKRSLMLTGAEFDVPSDVYEFCEQTVAKNKKIYDTWQEDFFLFEKTYPELFKLYQAYIVPKSVDYARVFKQYLKDDSLSMREANAIVLSELAKRVSSIIGGTADLAPSTMAVISDTTYFSKNNPVGRNLHFGVREHAMGGIANGIALYSSLMPFTSTFLSFSNYMIPSIRMAALMGLNVLNFFTHDSLLVGEDGPTHQPVEQITQLRCIPNHFVFRPADFTELIAGYDMAVGLSAPATFLLAKNKLPQITSSFSGAKKGGYIVSADNGKTDIAILASGSEVALALDVKRELNEHGQNVMVSSFPSLEVFESQTAQYKKSVIGGNAKLIVVIEASNDTKWLKYAPNSIRIGVNTYGKSGMGSIVYQKYGFSSSEISKKILENLK